MLYCPECQWLYADGSSGCEGCDGALREPMPNDPVLLMKIRRLKADMISPILDEMNIPYSSQGEMGVDFLMGMGNVLETYRFYVPYGAYREVREKVEAIFGEDEEIIRELDECVHRTAEGEP